MSTERVVIPLGEPWVDSEGIKRGQFGYEQQGEAMQLDYAAFSDPERRQSVLATLFRQLGAAVDQGFTLDELILTETYFSVHYSRGEQA